MMAPMQMMPRVKAKRYPTGDGEVRFGSFMEGLYQRSGGLVKREKRLAEPE
jgi:hypothetical protein